MILSRHKSLSDEKMRLIDDFNSILQYKRDYALRHKRNRVVYYRAAGNKRDMMPSRDLSRYYSARHRNDVALPKYVCAEGK